MTFDADGNGPEGAAAQTPADASSPQHDDLFGPHWAWSPSPEVVLERHPDSGGTPGFRRLANRRLAAGVAVVMVGALGGALISHAAWPVTRTTNGSANSAGGNGLLPRGLGGYGGSGQGFNGSGPGSLLPGGGLFGGGTDNGSSGSSASNSNASDGPTDAAAIARRAEAGLVDITTTLTDGTAAGTGMVLTSTGEVLTNNHVVTGAENISVRDVGNGKTYKATVVGYDRSEDVAVIQLTDATGLTTVTPAGSEPSSGAAVVGLGNAGGTGGTPSYAGGAIVRTGASITASSEYDGTSERLTGLLATDADIQAGDSGGPLLNTDGQVVGMDTAATEGSNGFSFQGSGSSIARGFAIPITTALTIAHQIESGASSSTVHVGPTAVLGVYIDNGQANVGGVAVAGTVAGGPAAKAGIAEGDVITSVDGTTVSTPEALVNEMTHLTPGSAVDVTYATSDGGSKTISVTLVSGPAE